jgi:hypothetical protein
MTPRSERRRRDRYLAWGVSPRYQASQLPEAPEGGDRPVLSERSESNGSRLRRKPQESAQNICRRSAAYLSFFLPQPWGSRPRLIICRRSAAVPCRDQEARQLLRSFLFESPRGWVDGTDD